MPQQYAILLTEQSDAQLSFCSWHNVIPFLHL